MRRDLDLIRAILLAVEAKEPAEPVRNTEIDVSDKDPVAMSEHIQLLTKAGFLEASISQELSPQGPRHCIVRGITWEGYEYLDSIRDPEIWKETKAKLAEVGGSASIETVKIIAGQIVRASLGLP